MNNVNPQTGAPWPETSKRVSLVVLTYNRAEMTERAIRHNVANANSRIDELIWVDNGSTDSIHDVMRAYEPDVCILNKTNLGVAKGYNRGWALTTGDYIINIECDMLMPDGWLAAFRTYAALIPNTGLACIFHKPLDPNRWPIQDVNGIPCQTCFPAGGRWIVSRDLLIQHIGYYREDFGLYGWEDVEWSERVQRTCERMGLLAYAIPGYVAAHLQGYSSAEDKDLPDYRAFKDQEIGDAGKKALVRRCRAENNPYYNPYA